MPLVPSSPVTVTFAGCGDAFGSGGRFQACIHLTHETLGAPVLLDCGTTSLTALRLCGLDPGEIGAVFLSHLHGDHFGGLPFLILDGQFSRRCRPLVVAGPPGTAQRLIETMECLFPGSSHAQRGFTVRVTELTPGHATDVGQTRIQAWQASHPSGAPALILRVAVGGKVIAYTGDTAWTPTIGDAARGADLLIAEAYYWDKPVPHHLRHADLAEHQSDLSGWSSMCDKTFDARSAAQAAQAAHAAQAVVQAMLPAASAEPAVQEKRYLRATCVSSASRSPVSGGPFSPRSGRTGNWTATARSPGLRRCGASRCTSGG